MVNSHSFKQLLAPVGGAVVALFAAPALAHHPLAGAPMETFTHGVLSGVGHPVLGFDHLFFVIAVGVAALLLGRALIAPAAYLGAMALGCLAAVAGAALPMQEVVIALSLLVVGGLLMTGRKFNSTVILALFAGFGLFHGAAFAGSLTGQEGGVGGMVLLGYLLGLIAIQYAIAVAAGWLAENVWNAVSARAPMVRMTGAAVAGVGLFLTLEHIEGPVLAALGLA